MFNPVAPYRYLLPNLYLSVADITNPDFLRVVVGPGLVSTSPAFMRSISSHPAGPHGRHNLHRVCQTAVTAPPRVCCVVWSHFACFVGDIVRVRWWGGEELGWMVLGGVVWMFV